MVRKAELYKITTQGNVSKSMIIMIMKSSFRNTNNHNNHSKCFIKHKHQNLVQLGKYQLVLPRP